MIHIKEKRGDLGTPLGALAVIIILMALGSLIMEIMRVRYMIHIIHDAMQQSSIYVMTENWDDVYVSTRDGYSGAYDYVGEETIDEADIYEHLSNYLHLNYEEDTGSYIFTTKNDNILYRIKNLNADIENTEYKNQDEYYYIVTTCDLDIPVYVLGVPIGLNIPLKTISTWTPTNYK